MVATVCPGRETLFQYSLGLLSGEARDALDSHLDSCPDCQAAIVTLDDADDTLIGRLRTPVSGESVLAEPQLEDALAAAMAMPQCPAGAAVELPPQHPGETPAAQAPPAGSLTSDMPAMLGEYRVLEELGRGGMGRVFKALHTKLDRVVAVKVLPRARVGDQNAIVRFEREMKAVGRLAHPNIVQAYDAREIDGTPVLIMEFVEGLDLAEIVRHVGPLPTADACELVRQTALALQCAHEHGLVHRDIKPSNIMLARSGEVKLLDLGLARVYIQGGASVGTAVELPSQHAGKEDSVGVAVQLPPQRAADDMTGAGQAMGTADYMAPEQASDSRTVDIRADLYSLGCTLYKLLSGRAPFSGPDYRTTLDKLNAHVHQPAPFIRRLVPDVPERLAAILDRLLAKDPDDRFATPAEVAEAIGRWCVGADLPALLERAVEAKRSHRTPGKGQAEGGAPAKPLAASQRWKSIAGLLILLLFVGGGGFALGILIRIQRDGHTYEFEAPEDSRTTIDKQGNPTVAIASKGEGGKTPTVNAAADLKALQGPWRVRRVEKGKDVDADWGDIIGWNLPLDPTTADRLEFQKPGEDWQLRVRQLAKVEGVGLVPMTSGGGWLDNDLEYRIDPTATPKTIDLVQGGDKRLAALGIYKIDGDRLTLSLYRYQSALKTDQRPRSFAVEPGSGEILFVMTRYRPTEEEKAAQQAAKPLEGWWAATAKNENGKPVPREELRQTVYCIGESDFTAVQITADGRRLPVMPSFQTKIFTLDVSKEPKQIAFVEQGYGGQQVTWKVFRGVFRLKGNDLEIAYRQGSQPLEPSQLKPGPGVTVLSLRKTQEPKQAMSGMGGMGMGGMGMGGQPAALNPAAEIKALKGSWRVVRIEKGKDADESWLVYDQGSFTAAKLDRLRFSEFSEDYLELVSLQDGSSSTVVYRIDPTVWPRTIDLSSQDSQTGPGRLAAVGVYEIQDNRLTLRLARFLPTVKSDQRPKSTRAPSGSGDILFVLERYQPSEDEKAIQDNWAVTGQIVNGKAVVDGKTRSSAKLRFSADYFFNPNPSLDMGPGFGPGDRTDELYHGVFALNSATMPKSITLFNNPLQAGNDDFPVNRRPVKMSGIYKFDGNRLTIAYRKGDTPPEKFESSPGSGVMLLALQKHEPSRTPKAVSPNGSSSVSPATETNPATSVLGGPPSEKAPPTVTVAHPIVREIPDYEELTGRIEPIQTAEVRPRVSGRLVKVHFQPGATVKQGDLLVELDPQPFLAQMKKEALDYEFASVRLKQAERELKLAKEANGKVPNSVSTLDVGALESKRAEAELVLQAAKLSQDAAKSRLEATKVAAPVSGKITQIVPLTIDKFVAADSKEPLATIVSLDTVYVCFDVYEGKVMQLRREMQEAEAKGRRMAPFPVVCRVMQGAPGDFPYQGKVESADAPVDPRTGTATWRATIPNKDGALLPGMHVYMRLITSAPHKTLLIPVRAIQGHQGQMYVFVVKDEVAERIISVDSRDATITVKSSILERRPISCKIEQQEENTCVVEEGLTESDRVAVSDAGKLRPGMTVKPQDADSPPSAPPSGRHGLK